MNVGEGMRKLEHALLVGIGNSIATLENSLAVSFKLKHKSTIGSSKSTWKHEVQQETWKHVHKDLQVSRGHTTSDSSQNRRWLCFPLTDEWIANLVYSYNMILLSNKITTKYSSSCKIAEPEKYYAKYKNPDIKDRIMYDSICWSSWWRQIYREGD